MSDTLETPAVVFDLGAQQLVVDENGEVIGELGAPGPEAQEAEIIDYVGKRLKRARAKLVGLEAERDSLLKQINDHYTPLISREQSFLRFLEVRYFGALRTLAERLKEACGGKTKTFHLRGVLTVSLRKVPSRIVVTDETTALRWAKENCADAVKTTEKLLVSQLPANLDPDPEVSGLFREPEKEGFKVE